MTIDNFDVDAPEVRRTLERAFVSRYGLDVGIEVAAEVVAWGWEHRDELADMANPMGYLYRVGQTKSKRLLKWLDRVELPAETAANTREPQFEPGLDEALARLNAEQRQAVVLVHCFGMTQPQVAEILDVELHDVRNRVHRGLKNLRASLGVSR